MSRHAITVHTETTTDDNAVIGYDPPLRTYFIQAFEDPKTEQPVLWLGTRLEQYPTLRMLLADLDAHGYQIDGLTADIMADMGAEASRPASPSLVERYGWPLR
ncbi:MAG: hypothetical protein AB7G25_00330 [Sphingomonadaceae bacterium]